MAPSYPNRMDPVADLLASEHPVAYRVCFAQALGGACVGLLLSQMYYWSNSEKARSRSDGSFYMTQEEITSQTGLTRTETDTARRKLRETGVLIEEKRGIPMKIWYRLDKDRLYLLLLKHVIDRGKKAAPNLAEKLQDGGDEGRSNLAENPQDGLRDTAEPTRRKPASLVAGLPQANTETSPTTFSDTSAENTTTGAGAASDAFVVVPSSSEKSEGSVVGALTAAGINVDAARRLVAEFGVERCLNQIARLPFRKADNPAAVLRRAIEGDWAADATQEVAERQSRQALTRAARLAKTEETDRASREALEREQQAVAAVWVELTDEERSEIDRRAWEHLRASNPAARRKIDGIIAGTATAGSALQASFKIVKKQALVDLICEKP